MQKHTKRQVIISNDAFISDVCHRCLCVISGMIKLRWPKQKNILLRVGDDNDDVIKQ